MKTTHRIITGIGATVLVLVGLAVLVIHQLSTDMCGNEIHTEIYSPNRELKIIVFERNCGATTGFSTQISIIHATDKLNNKSGNIFIGPGHPGQVNPTINWLSDKSLIIGGVSTASASVNMTVWGLENSVSIRYTSKRS